MKRILFILILAGLSALGYSQQMGGGFIHVGGGGGASVELSNIVYTNNMEEFQFSKIIHNVNGKLSHSVKLISTDTLSVMIDYIKIITEPATSMGTGTTYPVISVGDNSTSFNNIIGNTTLSANTDTILIPNIYYTYNLSDSICLKVQTASDARYFDFTVIAKYHKLDLAWRGGERYANSETEVLTNRFSVAQTVPQKTFIDSAITYFKDSLIWDNADILYMMNVGDSTGAGQNWIENDNNLTATGSASIDFTTKLGFINLTDAGHLLTGYVPSTDAVNLTVTSAATAIKSSTNINAAKYDYGAITDSDHKIFAAIRSGDFYYAYLENNAAVSASNSNSSGLFIQSRNVDTVWTYRNTTQLAKATSAHTDKPTQQLWLMDVNNGGSPLGNTRRRYSFFLAGGKMDAIQVRRLNNILTWWDARVSLYF